MTDEKYTPDSLADKLDSVLPPHQETVSADGDDALVDAAVWLASAPVPTLSPDAMSRIEAQILNVPVPNKVLRPRFSTRGLSRWALVASLLLVVIFAGAIPSALASIPGEPLYPIKQAIERVELSLANSPEAQAGVYIIFAERRTHEAEILYQRGQPFAELIASAQESAGAAVQIASEALDPDRRVELERRVILVDAKIAVMIEHLPETDGTAVPEITDTPANSVPTATSVPATLTATVTPSPTVTVTATLTETPTITATASPTPLPVNLVLEGPVQKIDGNIVTIYDIDIELSPDDPLLDVLQPGDEVVVIGDFDDDSGIIVEFKGDDVAMNENGETWRDSGDCSNPPPDWASANGWRARCQGGGQPGNAGNNGNGQGQGNGGGQGRGNDDDD